MAPRRGWILLSDLVIPPLLRYQINVVADRGLPTRMSRATLRGGVRRRIAVAVVLMLAPMAVVAALGDTSMAGLAVAAAVGVVLAVWFAALASLVIVTALWRRRLPPGTRMSAEFHHDAITYFLGRSGRIRLDEVSHLRDLGTAVLIVPARGPRILLPIELVPPPIAGYLTALCDADADSADGDARPPEQRTPTLQVQQHRDWVAEDIEGLTDFVAALRYWAAVQLVLDEQGCLRGAPLFGLPYVAAGRLVIPRGPGNAEDSDGFTDYSIRKESDGYSLRATTRSRGDWYLDRPTAWFGRFDDAARYFVGRNVAGPTRMRYRPTILPVTNLQWLDRGLAAGWVQSQHPVPGAVVSAKRCVTPDEPGRFYATNSGDSATSFLLNLSWRQLNETYTDGIPGIAKVPLRTFAGE